MVSNMDLAIDFYTKKLGLTLLNHYGDYYAEIQAPELLIGLHSASESTTVGNNISIGFGVSNFDGLIEDLKLTGIEFEIENDGWIRLAYFYDLDKNQLFFAENKG